MTQFWQVLGDPNQRKKGKTTTIETFLLWGVRGLHGVYPMLLCTCCIPFSLVVFPRGNGMHHYFSSVSVDCERRGATVVVYAGFDSANTWWRVDGVVHKLHAGSFINHTLVEFRNWGLFVVLKLFCRNPTERRESSNKYFWPPGNL